MKNITFCPECGKHTLLPNGDKAWLCSNCSFIYFHNAASAAAAILVCQNDILLTVRKHPPAQGMLDLPGGFVDYHETLEQALSREIKEELDLTITDWQYYSSYANQYEYQGILYHTVDAFFIKHFAERPSVTANDDVADTVWLKLDDIDLKQVGLNSIRNVIRFLQENPPNQTN